MIIVGLTGGIASGKSFIVGYLKKQKIPTHESDKFVKELYKKPSLSFIKFLIKEGFGEAIKNKNINKRKIRNIIFQNHPKKKKLEKYIHGLVKKNRDIFIKKNINKKIIFLDIPLLLENGLETICDYVCSTIAPIKTRENRALQRTGMTKKIFKLIVQSQIKDGERKKRSDFLINTKLSKPKTFLQVDKIINYILEKNK